MKKQQAKDSDIIYISKPVSVSMSDEWFDLNNNKHFWMIWRHNITKSFLERIPDIENKKALEIGCGNCVNLQMIESDTKLSIDGCDLNVNALKQAPKLRGRKFLYDISNSDKRLTGNYDIILLFDVIEHIENEELFIKNAMAHLKPGGIILINVPAHQFLFSIFDNEMGHFRRYSKKEMNQLLKDLNIKVLNSQYWGFFMVPVLLVRKFILFFYKRKIASTGFKIPHPIINKVFMLIMKTELWLFRNPPSGTSLFAVAIKNE